MSKKNKGNQEKAQEVKTEVNTDAKIDTSVLQGAPEGMSFEEMKKAVEEFKRLQKIVKSLPKEEKAKLMPPIRKREIPESLKDMASKVKNLVNSAKDHIAEIFLESVSTEKPDGNKSISLSWDDCDYSVAIIRKSKKTSSDEKEESEEKEVSE